MKNVIQNYIIIDDIIFYERKIVALYFYQNVVKYLN